jgi:uncharacterized membrane protein YbhN (UPF0104 family)
MLAVLVPRVHLGSLLPGWSFGIAAWLVAAIVATAAGMVLAAVRWSTVLSGMGLHTGLRTLVNHYLAGNFVGNFLPSTIGGDVLRVRRLALANGRGADTTASVVLERLTGWLVLPLITLVALAANPGLRELGGASALAAGIAVATLVVLALLLLAVGHPRLGGRLAGNDGWRAFAAAVHLGVNRLRHNPGAAFVVLASSLAYQLMVVLAAFCAARALGLDAVGLTATLAFFPAVAIAQVLPISLGGLGVREWSLVLFLDPLGVQAGRAMALGFLVYGLNLAVSLLGAPSFAIGSAPALDDRTEVEGVPG